MEEIKLYNNEFIRETSQNQVVFLSDKNSKGKERPWRDKKLKNGLLEDCYLSLARGDYSGPLYMPNDYYFGKARRLNLCATYLEFKAIMEAEALKLAKGYFCQITLCPTCSWRKEMKVRVQLGKVVAELVVMDYRFIFLTLTCENVYGDELNDTVDLLYSAICRLFDLRPVKRAVDGHFRALEITHDAQRKITKKMYCQDKKRKV